MALKLSVPSAVLAPWYAQLASFLDVGASLERAIATTSGPPVGLREQLRQRLLAGDSIEDALAHGATWLPAMDRSLIAAGAMAGRMPEMFRRLAAKHEESAAARRRALLASLYPLSIAHFGVAAFPIKLVVLDGDFAGYAWAVLSILVPAWAIGAVLVWAVWRRLTVATALLDALPFVGGYRRARALADLSFALEAQIVAGIRLDIAWLQAALAAGDKRLEPVAISAAEAVQRGEQVSSALAGRSELAAPFLEFWSNGEQTGRLDASLAHLHRHFADLATRRLTIASLLYPKLLFAAIAVWVAYQVIRFYAGYFGQFEELM